MDLLKFKIDDSVLQEFALHPELISRIDHWHQSVKDVNASIKFVKKSKKDNKIKDVSVLLEELDEIKDDLKWAKSKKGRFISYVSENYTHWQEHVTNELPVDDLMIRAHVSEYRLCVMGTVESNDLGQQVIDLVKNITGQDVLDYLRVT